MIEMVGLMRTTAGYRLFVITCLVRHMFYIFTQLIQELYMSLCT